jgi:hypothetical protein
MNTINLFITTSLDTAVITGDIRRRVADALASHSRH